MAKLDGAKVVVIGGASGVGFAVAAAALEAGAEVVVGSSQAPRIEAAAEKLGRRRQGPDRGCEGRGFGRRLLRGGGPVRPSGLHRRRLGPHVRRRPAISTSRPARPGWKCGSGARPGPPSTRIRQIAKDGSITLTGGMLAHRPMPGAPLVTASAHTTEGLAMGLARDLAPIRVNAVCLGLIMSEQVQTMGEAMIKGFTANLPLPRGGTVEEAAEAYLYLMRATYVTGQIVRVDGGGSLV